MGWVCWVRIPICHRTESPVSLEGCCAAEWQQAVEGEVTDLRPAAGPGRAGPSGGAWVQGLPAKSLAALQSPRPAVP